MTICDHKCNAVRTVIGINHAYSVTLSYISYKKKDPTHFMYRVSNTELDSVYNKKKVWFSIESDLKKAATYSPTIVVPSALAGLTSLFGMGRGEPRRYNHLSFNPLSISPKGRGKSSSAWALPLWGSWMGINIVTY